MVKPLQMHIEHFSNTVNIPSQLPTNVLPEWLAVTNGLKPGFRTLLYNTDKHALHSLINDLHRIGMHMRYREASVKGFNHLSPQEKEVVLKAKPIILYIAKSIKDANNLYKAEKDGSTELGKALGYPNCCISWMTELDRQTLHEKRPCNFPIMSVQNTQGEFLAELNNLLWNLPHLDSPFYLISHYPCSYNCSESTKYAQKLFVIIEKLCPEFSGFLKHILSRPAILWSDSILPEKMWDENKGLVFKGRVRNNTVYYESYISLRKKRNYSELGLAFGDRLVAMPDKAYTMLGNKFTGAWWNKEHGEPYILDFKNF